MLATLVLFGLSLSARHVQTRRRLHWLQKQRHTGQQFSGMNEEASLLLEALRGRHPLADLRLQGAEALEHSRAVFPSWLPVYIRDLWCCHMLERLLCRRRLRRRDDHMLSLGDLPYHAVRIYLHGENSPRDPWRLSEVPPEGLAHLIDESRWRKFATEINRCCSEGMRRQFITEGVLRWLYLPVAEHVRWRLRFSRAAQVAAYVHSCSEDSRPDETFWRLSRDSTSRFGLKFGTDRQMALAFVDVLDYGKSLEDWVVKPQLPMVIVSSGDGEYTAPYQLDYSDPFVQSVAQYLDRRTWHQVLLTFNLVARLLPPNPTEEDIRPLRRSMHRVSSRVLLQTDLECHAVLFEVSTPKPNYQSKKRKPLTQSRSATTARPLSRQNSWEQILAAASAGRQTSAMASPTGGQTPVLQQPDELTLRRRLALVLTQRVKNTSTIHSISSGFVHREFPATRQARALVSANAQLEMLHKAVPLKASCLASPTECLNLSAGPDSPPISFMPAPNVPDFAPLDGVRSAGNGVYEGFNDMLRQRTDRTMASSIDMSFDLDSEPNSPDSSGLLSASQPLLPRTAPRSFSREVPMLRPLQPGRRSAGRSMRSCLQRLLHDVRGCCEVFARRLEASLHSCAAPWNIIYGVYLRRLRGLRAIGGVGRQPGLYLRHRKPRGSQASTLLCLLLALLVAVLGFIAQSSILFRLSPGHGAFFAALLCPPFADLLALVTVTLFLCGAADGTSACLFVVASNLSTAVALVCRVRTMDKWRSSGLLHVLGEYFIVFTIKVFVCRLVNLMIAYSELEPELLESSGNEVDHEWVREQVLFGPHARTPFARGPGVINSDVESVSAQHPRLQEGVLPARRDSFQEEMNLEQNSHSWLMRGLNTPAGHRPLSALMSDS
eukprot:TRINITY_DN59353_c0_g1_i1.p1 TRINITY_DN59353_c0_g1~~TRINITY_DN59353_c0_g1_i1.p1  ORF type:complete len:889 (+),score=67.95 TRINITY_DN59353_c0_g1_i1:513-3179(+)